MNRRRSPRLHPQIQASEQAAGVIRRRSLRLHPQIHASDKGDGMAPRRSPRLHPQQVQASEKGAGVTRRRRSRGTLTPEAASLPDDDDMLREILLRLPPQPSSLPHASAVCRRWRGLVTDPKFHRQFYAHHRKPPLLGVFQNSNQGIVFNPILDPPDRVPPQRFDLGRCSRIPDCGLLHCRHGRVLVRDWACGEVVVCAPITGEQRRMAIPREIRRVYVKGVVLCAAVDHGHVHHVCHWSPFKVVLVSMYTNDKRLLACVYTSETGIWGNLISAEAPDVLAFNPAVFVGNCIYWLFMKDDILKFNLDENILTVIRGPPVTNAIRNRNCIIQIEDGVVGFAVLCYPDFHIWQRNVNDHGVATWVPWKSIEMHNILKLPPQVEGQVRNVPIIQGYDEDSDVIFLNVDGSIYMVQLKSMQSRKLYEITDRYCYHPFKSFYAPGTTSRGCDEADMLHDP